MGPMAKAGGATARVSTASASQLLRVQIIDSSSAHRNGWSAGIVSARHQSQLRRSFADCRSPSARLRSGEDREDGEREAIERTHGEGAGTQVAPSIVGGLLLIVPRRWLEAGLRETQENPLSET